MMQDAFALQPSRKDVLDATFATVAMRPAAMR